jgi:hypothetical protein
MQTIDTQRESDGTWAPTAASLARAADRADSLAALEARLAGWLTRHRAVREAFDAVAEEVAP